MLTRSMLAGSSTSIRAEMPIRPFALCASSLASASRRGAELTGKLLAFSRRQVLQPSAVDVGQLVHSVAGMLRRTMDQRIRIEVDASATCPPVLADPGQLDAALLNIAINARDAMLEGGTLRFAAARVDRLPQALWDQHSQLVSRLG